MKYARLGATNLEVSEFCLGTMMFGGKTEKKEAVEIIAKCVDAGVNFIDTADVYNEGRAEEITGAALGALRGRVVLASKVGMKVGAATTDRGVSRYHIIRGVEASLRRLATDRIDLLYIHWPFEQMNIDEMARALEDLVRQGKILYPACSNFPAWLMTKTLWAQDRGGFAPFTAGQYPYNLIERGIEVEILPAALALGVGIVVYRPIAIGLLSGKYLSGDNAGTRAESDERIARWGAKYAEGLRGMEKLANERGRSMLQSAIRWVCSHPAITSAIIGISRLNQVDDNLAAFEWEMTDAERMELAGLFPTEPWEEAGGSFPPWRRSFEIMRRP